MTGFANTKQIFIRYRIGDLAAWAAEPCPCGRESLPVLSDLLGRQEDTVVAPDGREMVRFHGLFVGLTGVAEGQVVQESLHRFLINIVPTPNRTRDESQTVHKRLIERLGPDIEVEIREVESIPRETNGKFRAVISHVKPRSAIA